MRQTVNNKQLISILFITIITGSVLTVAKVQAICSGTGAWIPLICTGILYGFGATLIIHLNKTYEGDTLFEYSGKIIGRFGAYLLAVIYVMFYVLVSSYYCVSFFQMVKANFLPRTPEIFLLILTMPFLGYFAYKGFTNNGRLAELIGIVYLGVSLVTFIAMFYEGKITNFLPLFIKAETGRYFSAIINTINQFAGVTLLTLIPVSKANKTISKAVFWTFIGIAVFYILVVYGSYAMIGVDEVKHYNYPLIDATRLVEFKRIEFFQRVDVAYMTIGFMRVFAAKGIVYMLIVEYVSRMLPKVKRLTIVIGAGAVLTILDAISMEITKINTYMDIIKTFYSVLVTFVIPGSLLIITKVKKSGQKKL